MPSWLKIERNGTTLTGYSSADGVTWTQNGAATITMASSVYVGMAVTGSGATKRAAAQFDNISFTGSDTPVLTSIVVSPSSDVMEPASKPVTPSSATIPVRGSTQRAGAAVVDGGGRGEQL